MVQNQIYSKALRETYDEASFQSSRDKDTPIIFFFFIASCTESDKIKSLAIYSDISIYA